MDLNVLVSVSGVKCGLPSMMIASQHGSKAAGWLGKFTQALGENLPILRTPFVQNSLENLSGTGAFTKLITHLIVNVNVIGTFLRAFAVNKLMEVSLTSYINHLWV